MTADPSRPLPNARHERFAQEIEGGTDAADAYARAGYKGGYANARKLKSHADIRARVAWLQARRAEMHAAVEVTATHIAAEKLSITKERVLGELAKIAFADIRQAVRWGRSPIDTADENANPNGLNIYPVELVPSSEIDDDIAAAVAEVSLTTNGVRIKMHDKKSALVDLGKYLGLFIQRHEHGAPGDFARFSDVELTEEIAREASELGIVLPGNETAH